MNRVSLPVIVIFCLFTVSNGQSNEVCSKHNTCGHQVHNNVSYTCERRYAKATRCQLLTLTKVVRMAEIEIMHTVLESGLERLDKAIENLKCHLQSMKSCTDPGNCVVGETNQKCVSKSNDSNVNTTTCKDGFTFYCEGLDPGTSQAWCMKHCSVGWPQCHVYCNCTCRSNELPMTTATPLHGIPQCESESELKCEGKESVIPSKWCNNYCGRNGRQCTKFCNCQCRKKNGAGFLTQRVDTTSTTTSSTTVLTTLTTRPTLWTKPRPITCRFGFMLKCRSKSKSFSSGWCSASCRTHPATCPTFCVCRCDIIRGSGFLPEINDETTTDLTSSTTSTTPQPTTTTPTLTTIPSTKIITTTRSPFLDMCETDYKFGCKGKQPGVRQEWCTKYCLIGWTHCNNFCVCSCLPLTTTAISTTSTTVSPTAVAITTRPTTTSLFVLSTPGQTMARTTNHKPPRQTFPITTTPDSFMFITPQQPFLLEFETMQCPADNIRCRWNGPNLGRLNHKLKRWCEDVCSIRTKYCLDLRHICRCTCLKFQMKRKVCGASKKKKNHIGVDDWCNRNCAIGFCPKTHCACNYI